MKQIIILMLLAIMFGCSKKHKTELYENEQATIESNIKQFNPNFNSDASKPNIVMTFKVVNSKIQPHILEMYLVDGGPRPYSPDTGDFQISLFDKNKKIISMLNIDNPLIIRVNDPVKKRAPVQFILDGPIQIIIPYNNEMVYIRMRDLTGIMPDTFIMNLTKELKFYLKKK